MRKSSEKSKYPRTLLLLAAAAFLTFMLCSIGFVRSLDRLLTEKRAAPPVAEAALISAETQPPEELSPQEIYDAALSLALGGKYSEAAGEFYKILDYPGSARLYSRCLRIAGWLEDEYRTPLLSEDMLFPNGYMKNVYEADCAYIAVSDEISEDCRFFIYYPGGKDVEINIDFIYHYFMNPAPDTIAVFLRSNGLYDARTKLFTAVELLEQAAAERGVFVREMMLVGSSLGAYPAMQGAAIAQDETGIKISCLLSLDAGDDWNSPYVLSAGQCSRLAELATPFYLLESPWVGTDRPAIYRMVARGMDVILVGCENDQHERITYDAMGMGLIHWALGDRLEPCPLDIYTFNKLYIE